MKKGEEEGMFVVLGGCVFNVCVMGCNLCMVFKKVYVLVWEISWLGMQICFDIGKCVVEVEFMFEFGIFKFFKMQ